MKVDPVGPYNMSFPKWYASLAPKCSNHCPQDFGERFQRCLDTLRTNYSKLYTLSLFLCLPSQASLTQAKWSSLDLRSCGIVLT